MLKRKEKIRKEDVLTGFLYALEYLTEILFFYGAGVVMYGFWQGITGGYLTLFAGMVISGAFVFHILLEIFLKERAVTDQSVLTEVLMEGILFVLLSFRMSWKAGVTALCGCALILIVHGLLREKEKTYVLPFCRYAFVLVIGWMALNLFQKKTITFADSVTLLSGALFFDGETFHQKTEETGAGNKEILSFLSDSGNRIFLILSLFSLSPLYYQILNKTDDFQLSSGYRMVILWAAVSLIFLLSGNVFQKASFRIQKISVFCILIIGSIILMHTSVMTGILNLLCILALTAAFYLFHYTGHDSSFTWNMVSFTGSHIVLIVMLVIVFQLYDGITVNYMSVLMTYFLNMAGIYLIQKLHREDV